MNHVVKIRHLLVRVRKNRKIHFGVLGFLDVSNPFMVGIKRIHTDRNGLDPSLIKFRLQFGRVAEFGRADRRKVFRMRKQHHPAVAGPLMKIDGSLSGFLRKVGSDVAQAKSSHDRSPVVVDGQGGKYFTRPYRISQTTCFSYSYASGFTAGGRKNGAEENKLEFDPVGWLRRARPAARSGIQRRTNQPVFGGVTRGAPSAHELAIDRQLLSRPRRGGVCRQAGKGLTPCWMPGRPGSAPTGGSIRYSRHLVPALNNPDPL